MARRRGGPSSRAAAGRCREQRFWTAGASFTFWVCPTVAAAATPEMVTLVSDGPQTAGKRDNYRGGDPEILDCGPKLTWAARLICSIMEIEIFYFEFYGSRSQAFLP